MLANNVHKSFARFKNLIEIQEPLGTKATQQGCFEWMDGRGSL
jgi:hypothetical protein